MISKYYFSKPKSEIVKDVLTWLFIGGALTIAATSPYFLPQLLKRHQRLNKYPRRKVSDTFSRLRREGLIHIEKYNHQIYVSLTPEGRKKAGIFQINHLSIKKPKRWDGLWRILLFDIPQKKKIKREALRGKLRELGFLPFQKSVWIHAFPCKSEVDLLCGFFGFSSSEIQLITAKDIGEDTKFRRIFKV